MVLACGCSLKGLRDMVLFTFLVNRVTFGLDHLRETYAS